MPLRGTWSRWGGPENDRPEENLSLLLDFLGGRWGKKGSDEVG